MNRSTTVHTNIVMASLLLLLTIAAITIDSTSAHPHFCIPCPDGICADEGPCLYDYIKDNCGRKICKRGPDEECGGKFKLRGVCGDGLSCRCGRCIGCSTDTMECSSQEFDCNK